MKIPRRRPGTAIPGVGSFGGDRHHLGQEPGRIAGGLQGLRQRRGGSRYSWTNTIVHFTHNTIYGCGWPGTPQKGATGCVHLVNLKRHAPHFTNNIIVSTGEPYMSGWSDQNISPQEGHNLWFGKAGRPHGIPRRSPAIPNLWMRPGMTFDCRLAAQPPGRESKPNSRRTSTACGVYGGLGRISSRGTEIPAPSESLESRAPDLRSAGSHEPAGKAGNMSEHGGKP